MSEIAMRYAKAAINAQTRYAGWGNLDSAQQRAAVEAVAEIRDAEIKRLRKIEAAVRGYADYCRRSINAGPITKGPSKEAAYWREIHAALGTEE